MLSYLATVMVIDTYSVYLYNNQVPRAKEKKWHIGRYDRQKDVAALSRAEDAGISW